MGAAEGGVGLVSDLGELVLNNCKGTQNIVIFIQILDSIT